MRNLKKVSKKSKKCPSLARLLRYKNRDVIARFSDAYNLSQKQSTTIFQDLLRFLWLGERFNELSEKQPEKLFGLSHFSMIPTLDVIDEMWHTFLLYSAEYRNFCTHYFGAQIDHHPGNLLRNANLPVSAAKKSSRDSYGSSELDMYLTFICSELGVTVLTRWMCKYPQEYNLRKLLENKIASLMT